MTNQQLCKRYVELLKALCECVKYENKVRFEEVFQEKCNIVKELDKRDSNAFYQWVLNGANPNQLHKFYA